MISVVVLRVAMLVDVDLGGAELVAVAALLELVRGTVTDIVTVR